MNSISDEKCYICEGFRSQYHPPNIDFFITKSDIPTKVCSLCYLQFRKKYNTDIDKIFANGDIIELQKPKQIIKDQTILNDHKEYANKYSHRNVVLSLVFIVSMLFNYFIVDQLPKHSYYPLGFLSFILILFLMFLYNIIKEKHNPFKDTVNYYKEIDLKYNVDLGTYKDLKCKWQKESVKAIKDMVLDFRSTVLKAEKLEIERQKELERQRQFELDCLEAEKRKKEAVERERKQEQELIDWRRRREYWLGLNEDKTGRRFEKAVQKLFKDLNKKAYLTGGTGDRGIDLVVDNGIGVQCKCWRKSVPGEEVNKLIGACFHKKYKEGVLISLVGFTKEAKEIAALSSHNGLEIKLWSINKLVELSKEVENKDILT